MSDSRQQILNKKNPLGHVDEVISEMVDFVGDIRQIRQLADSATKVKNDYNWWRDHPIFGPLIRMMPKNWLFRMRNEDFETLITDINQATCSEDLLRGFTKFLGKGGWKPTSGNTNLMPELFSKLKAFDFSSPSARALKEPSALEVLSAQFVEGAKRSIEGPFWKAKIQQELNELPKLDLKNTKEIWRKLLANSQQNFAAMNQLEMNERSKELREQIKNKVDIKQVGEELKKILPRKLGGGKIEKFKMDPDKLAELHALIAPSVSTMGAMLFRKGTELDEIRKLSPIDLANLSYGTKIKLPIMVLAKLPPEELAKLPVNVIMYLPTDKLSALPIDVLAKLPPERMSKLPPEVQYQIPLEAVARYKAQNPDIFVKLPVGVLDRFSLEELKDLPQKAFQSLPGEILAKLSVAEIMELPREARERLPESVRQSLPAPGLCKASNELGDNSKYVPPKTPRALSAERKAALLGLFANAKLKSKPAQPAEKVASQAALKK
jgi:hypothetical protein